MRKTTRMAGYHWRGAGPGPELAAKSAEQAGEINHNRRRFFGAPAMTVAAAQFGMIGSANAQASKTEPAAVPAIKPGTNTSLAPPSSQGVSNASSRTPIRAG